LILGWAVLKKGKCKRYFLVLYFDSRIKKFFTNILMYLRLTLEDDSEINIITGDKMKNKPVRLEENYKLIINSYSHQGEGIGRINNFTI